MYMIIKKIKKSEHVSTIFPKKTIEICDNIKIIQINQVMYV